MLACEVRGGPCFFMSCVWPQSQVSPTLRVVIIDGALLESRWQMSCVSMRALEPQGRRHNSALLCQPEAACSYLQKS